MTSTLPWHEVEIELPGSLELANPYTDQDVWVDFSDGTTVLRRPAYLATEHGWRVRIAAPAPGRWRWTAAARVEDPMISSATGVIEVVAGDGDDHHHPHAAVRHGFMHRTEGARALVHADGHPYVLVGDTPWALPWRATPEQATTYAKDRASKGFNAALLMTVQPDMDARGPRNRSADGGFDVGFEDLRDGRLTMINLDYFDRLDALLSILVDHGITPVLQPVFFGFGWKGLRVAGPVVPDADYARYCRYLVARYGARPAIYLVGADGSGTESQVAAGGAEVQAWDCYGQPTGIHYRPHARNDAHQSADWLDFQWCQTGHEGDHVPERVTDLWHHEPVRPCLNGEPTYENSGRTGKGAGWWQGHEAWSNLCAGGTMGVVYGAGSLWQWVLRPDEPGQSEYFTAPGCGWREAIDFEGSRYVGQVGRILDGLPTTNLVPCWDVAINGRGLLDPGVLYLGYLEHGGRVMFLDADDRVPLPYRVIDPRTGAVITSGVRESANGVVELGTDGPAVIICAAN